MTLSPVEELVEKQNIQSVLAEYCERLDEYDIAGVAACFSEEAVTDYGAGRGGEVRGRDAIAHRIATGQGVFRHTHHQLGQIRVRIDDDIAKATSYVTAWHELESGKKDVVCLRYLDELLRTDTGWLITRRRVEVNLVDGFEGVEWTWVKRQ